MAFADRIDAGEQLAELLAEYRGKPDVVVVGLPRGGVPVAARVAEALQAPLDVIVVRKLGVPFQPELAMGAIGEDDISVVNDHVIASTHVTPEELAAVDARERRELNQRAARFRHGHPRRPLTGKHVVIVDDGIATGATARAACQVARAEGAAHVTLAVPVAPPDWTSRLGDTADDYVAIDTPRMFHAVGQFYRDFDPTTDGEVLTLLDAAQRRMPTTATTTSPHVVDEDVDILIDDIVLSGHLHVPESARGLVIFAHGSGSSRHSPRNRYVASVLREAGFATLLFDLLSPAEEICRGNVFDIELLARRLVDVTAWARDRADLGQLTRGFFGASTGAAAALWAAADPSCDVAAIVSRGGRPDLAEPRLGLVRAPTLLVVGSDDTVVLALNRRAFGTMNCRREMVVVPGASHLFEEPGTLREAAEAARDWFLEHVAAPAAVG